VIGLSNLLQRRDNKIERDVLAILARSIRSRVDAQQISELAGPPGLFSELAQDTIDQMLVAVEKATWEGPFATLTEMRSSSDKEQRRISLDYRMHDNMAQTRS